MLVMNEVVQDIVFVFSNFLGVQFFFIGFFLCYGVLGYDVEGKVI